MNLQEAVDSAVHAPEPADTTPIFTSQFNDYLLLLQVMEERKLSEFDARCFLASLIINEWMQDPDVAYYIKEKQANYIHDKGWSKDKKYKENHTICQEAFLVLPSEIRNQPKRLMRWLKENHRYLVFKGAV